MRLLTVLVGEAVPLPLNFGSGRRDPQAAITG